MKRLLFILLLPVFAFSQTQKMKYLYADTSRSLTASQTFYVKDTLSVLRFQLANGAVANYVLLTDASGDASWQPVSTAINDTLILSPNGLLLIEDSYPETILRANQDSVYSRSTSGASLGTIFRINRATGEVYSYSARVLGTFQVTGNSTFSDLVSITDTLDVPVIRYAGGGPVTVADSLKLTGNISKTTSDGSDSDNLALGGGGAVDSTRGATLTLYGNESTSYPGYARLRLGNPSGTQFIVTRNGIDHLTVGAAENALRSAAVPLSLYRNVTTITSGGLLPLYLYNASSSDVMYARMIWGLWGTTTSERRSTTAGLESGGWAIQTIKSGVLNYSFGVDSSRGLVVYSSGASAQFLDSLRNATLGNIAMTATGKDIGSSGTPVDTLTVNRVVENYKAWGNLYIDDNDPDTVTTASATDTVTMRDWNTSGLFQGVTLTDSCVTVTRAGTYRISFAASFQTSAPAEVHAYLFVNTAIKTQGAFQRTVSTPTATGSASFSTILSLAASDRVKVRLHGDAAETFYVLHGSLIVERID